MNIATHVTERVTAAGLLHITSYCVAAPDTGSGWAVTLQVRHQCGTNRPADPHTQAISAHRGADRREGLQLCGTLQRELELQQSRRASHLFNLPKSTLLLANKSPIFIHLLHPYFFSLSNFSNYYYYYLILFFAVLSFWSVFHCKLKYHDQV